jgi:hypothetical protein
MSTNQLRFVAIAAQAYGGITKNKHAKIEYPESATITKEKLNKIDPDVGVVIYFPENFPYVQLEGDQGQGKTSLANAIIELGGAEPAVNAENTDEHDKRVYARFWGKDGKLYDVSLTRSGCALYEVETTEEGEPKLNQRGETIRKDVRSPKAMLQQVLGPTGISPLKVAAMQGTEQIRWLRSLYSLSQDVLKVEVEMNANIKKHFDERTRVGQNHERLKRALSVNEYYTNLEHWRTWFGEHREKYKDVSRQMEVIKAQYKAYSDTEDEFNDLKNKKITKTIEDAQACALEIVELEKRLVAAKQKAKNLAAELKKQTAEAQATEKWLKEHQQMKVDYDNITKLVEESTEFQLKQQAYDRMLEQKAEMEGHEKERTRLTEVIAKYRDMKKKFIQEFSPTSIPEFEVCIPDEEDKREGLFFRKKPLTHIAESEQWEWFVPLCKELNIRLLIVENINNLGSGSVEKFNEFAQSGAYIFGTLMNRKEKALKVTFNLKVAEI